MSLRRVCAAIAAGAAIGVLVGVGGLYLVLVFGPDTMADW